MKSKEAYVGGKRDERNTRNISQWSLLKEDALAC